MIGLFQENGPCQFYNGASTPSINKNSFNTYANMFVKTNPVYTFDTYIDSVIGSMSINPSELVSHTAITVLPILPGPQLPRRMCGHSSKPSTSNSRSTKAVTSASSPNRMEDTTVQHSRITSSPKTAKLRAVQSVARRSISSLWASIMAGMTPSSSIRRISTTHTTTPTSKALDCHFASCY